MRKKVGDSDYDVALSFAGEDRPYVQQVAAVLHQIGVKVFYDEYHRVNLWGKDLYSHLDDVYRKKSRYCVVFVSKAYKKKLWANHERQSAQARAFRSRKEYILPAKFDVTEIPGLRPTQGFIDLRTVGPKELAWMIVEKLGMRDEIDEMISYLKHTLGDYEITADGANLQFRCDSEKFYSEFPVRLMLEMYRAGELERMFLIPAVVPF